MGNDGGSIPKRRELVKEAARAKTTTEAKETLQEQQEYCWTTCPLSQGPLKEPVVSDWGGNLYNKDAVIEFLLPAEDTAAEAVRSEREKLLGGRIRSLKDVVGVKFHVDESLESSGKTAAHFEKRWACPVTSKTLGAGVKAVYLVPCGHAFEEVAIKNASEGRCLQCEEPYEDGNVISILPLAAAERDRLVARAQRLKEAGLTHSLKKLSGKKRKKGAAEVFDAESGVIEAKDKTKSGFKSSNVSNGIKNASTASLNAKVQAELDEKAKRRKLDANDNIKGLFSTSDGKAIRDSDYMTRGFSLPRSGR